MLIHGWCYMAFTGGEEIGKVRSVEQISRVKSVQQSVWLQSVYHEFCSCCQTSVKTYIMLTDIENVLLNVSSIVIYLSLWSM